MHNARVEQISCLHDFGASLAVGFYLHEHKLALHKRSGYGIFLHFYYVHKLVELFHALLYAVAIVIYSGRYPRILASAYGIPSKRVIDRKDLMPAVEEMMAADGPFFLEACVAEEGNVMPMIPPGGTVDNMLMEC